jgi:GNAT superfamily N-acetyltransferase
MRGGDRDDIGQLWLELMRYHQQLDPRFLIPPDGEQRYVRHAVDMMRSRNARVLVAEDLATRRLVGYLMAELQQRPPLALSGLYGFISDVCITETWRHQGVGRTLFEEIRRWFVARKATAIELYVSEANPTALRFWQEMGLTPFLKLMHLDL